MIDRPLARRSLLAAGAAAVFAAALVPAGAGRQELVILKKADKQYHRPGCPLVADTSDVVVLDRKQAEARGHLAHPACDPAASGPAASGRGGTTESDPNAATVYLDGSRHYHRKDCKRLGKAPKTDVLERAGRSHWPCPVCKPPIRRRVAEPAVPGTGRRGG